MATKEQQDFISELHRMSAYEVRENTSPSVQPDALKRAMAVTELEKRRQARAPSTIRSGLRLPVTLLALIILSAGAVVYWKFF